MPLLSSLSNLFHRHSSSGKKSTTTTTAHHLFPDVFASFSEPLSYFHQLNHDLILFIFTFLPLDIVERDILRVSKRIRHDILSHMQNGSFFRERERQCFVEVFWGGMWDVKRDEKGVPSGEGEETSATVKEAPDADFRKRQPFRLGSLDRGFPQLYRDLYHFQKYSMISEFCGNTWMNHLRQRAIQWSAHIEDYNFEAYSNLVNEVRNTIQLTGESSMLNRHPLCLTDDEFFFILLKWDMTIFKQRCARVGTRQLKRTFVLETLRHNSSVFVLLNESWKNDRSFVRDATRINGLLLPYVDSSLREDRQIVMEAVKSNGLALHHASQALREDPEIALQAVTQNGHSMMAVGDNLKGDRAFCVRAVKKNPFAFMFCSSELKSDTELIGLAEAKDKFYKGSIAMS
mmetsp:Transcript_3433/g.13057  ORF Transcript_3433/g.13057 Transcript_3433/m.13057 type:complete len:402 (-) Transcript_3433:2664-3869(-)